MKLADVIKRTTVRAEHKRYVQAQKDHKATMKRIEKENAVERKQIRSGLATIVKLIKVAARNGIHEHKFSRKGHPNQVDKIYDKFVEKNGFRLTKNSHWIPPEPDGEGYNGHDGYWWTDYTISW